MKRKNLKRSAILGALMSLAILGSAWAANIEVDDKWSNQYTLTFKNSSGEQTGQLLFDTTGVWLVGANKNDNYVKVVETSGKNAVMVKGDNVVLDQYGKLDLAGAISAKGTIANNVENKGQGQGTAVAMNLQATTKYDTWEETVQSKIATNEITQKMHDQYGDSLFQMQGGSIKLEKSGGKGTYGITIEDRNSGQVLISSQHASNGNSASLSVNDNSITDTVTNGATGVKYTVNTNAANSPGTTFTQQGGTAGYSYTNIQGGDISTDNITLRNAGTLTAGSVKINRNGIVAGNKKITSVADGLIALGSKEAVNGGQISQLKTDIDNQFASLNTKIDASVTEIRSGDKNIAVAENGEKGYKISLQKDLSLDSVAFASDADGNQASVNSKGMTASDADGNQASVDSKGVTASDGTKTISFTTEGISAGGQTIQNVADGLIAEGSTEAVNGGQVYSLKRELETLNTKIETNVTEISSDDANIEVNKEENKNNYKIGLKKDLSLNSAEFTSEKDATRASIGSKGMTASDADGNQASVDSKGVTASDGTKTISFTTEGISAGGQKIQNVADGEADTDAVNFGQLSQEKNERVNADTQLQQQVNDEAKNRTDADAQLQQRMDEVERGLDGRFDKLGDRIDKVGAGAAALAALHPLDYDPDDKLNFAVGLGNYRGEQAAALGAFYRPNEAVMFSVGGTMGNDDNMVNLGVSFALDGKRAKAKESRAQLEKKVESMSSELAEVKAQLALLMQQTNNKK